jgi:hypothetical protein
MPAEKSKHTKEPWVLTSAGISESSGRLLGIEEQRANLARIVACVNALAGITDPSAALKAAREAILRVRARLSEVEQKSIADCDAALRALNGDDEQ